MDLQRGQKQDYIHFEKENSDNLPLGPESSLVLELSFGHLLILAQHVPFARKITFVLTFEYYLEERHVFTIQSLLFK